MVIVFMLILIFFVFYIQSKISKMHRTITAIANEITELIKSGKSYTKYVSASIGASIFGKILRMITRDKSKNDDN